MLRRFLAIFVVCFGVNAVSAFIVNVHQNMPEEGMLYMEFQGTNQMRWVADYMKAKAGGRYSGTCVNINYTANEMSYGNNTQCGALSIERVGGVKPDYFWDAFWDDLLFFSWHVPDFGIYSNNFTSWYHFVNLLKTNEDGDPLVTNNYNTYDGYAYNQTYGFPNIGIDYILAVFMNNAQMSVNLPNCSDSNCQEWQGISNTYKANPAIDYKQNGSTTPVSNGSGSKATEQADGTNYNCFSDVALIGSCPDKGAEYGGTTQVPNVDPGAGTLFSGDEDWVIYEPATNAAAFYYNEMWLEGLASMNGNNRHSLQTAPIAGRYYTVTGAEMLYFTVVQHWAGDMTQQAHIWSTIGYNHGDYESYADEKYGTRVIGGSNADKNYEDYGESQAYANSWQNRYNTPVGNINRLLMEQVFRTYHNRLRSGYDILTSSDRAVWTRAGIWAVRNATAEMAIITEKAVLDLRKCRNGAACNNS
ncbi:hypothetical protein [Turneriella parva]|uniref:Uncharacterized protein n=1 Tax=Turneriella parva (strain ATCC BAA-1111 / DSM 21527 / NCTC 11395 / H) TaxID=869212 RepID=I4BBD3_TURPD|nr:hypothetical protein [Turneriella parva]AFM14590.1 hypothetical protein Turpa_3956 [Turneriella parva DSM 21527]